MNQLNSYSGFNWIISCQIHLRELFLCTVHLVFSLKKLIDTHSKIYLKNYLAHWSATTENISYSAGSKELRSGSFSPIYDTKMRNQLCCKKICFLQSGFLFILSGSLPYDVKILVNHQVTFFFFICPAPLSQDFHWEVANKQCPELGMDRKQCLLPCLCLLRIAYTKVQDYSSGLGFLVQSSFGCKQFISFSTDKVSLQKPVLVHSFLSFMPVKKHFPIIGPDG